MLNLILAIIITKILIGGTLKSISTQELNDLFSKKSDFTLLDVRENEEIAIAKIQSSTHIPMGQIVDRIDEIDKNKPVIVMCHSGGRSARVCVYLAENGYDATDLAGGIISWSINPETIIDKEEIKTARLNERLNAAKLASDAGFKIAFHFDPLIYFSNWEKEYRDLVDQIFDIIPQDRIQWVSFGTLRYINSLKDIVENRFPKSKIFLGEFVKGKDGKMRYIKNFFIF